MPSRLAGYEGGREWGRSTLSLTNLQLDETVFLSGLTNNKYVLHFTFMFVLFTFPKLFQNTVACHVMVAPTFVSFGSVT